MHVWLSTNKTWRESNHRGIDLFNDEHIQEDPGDYKMIYTDFNIHLSRNLLKNLLSLYNCLQFCELIPESWNHFGIIRYCHEKLLQNTTSSDLKKVLKKYLK